MVLLDAKAVTPGWRPCDIECGADVILNASDPELVSKVRLLTVFFFRWSEVVVGGRVGRAGLVSIGRWAVHFFFSFSFLGGGVNVVIW